MGGKTLLHHHVLKVSSLYYSSRCIAVLQINLLKATCEAGYSGRKKNIKTSTAHDKLEQGQFCVAWVSK